MFLLQKSTQLMKVHANRLASLNDNLKGMNVPLKTEDGKDTQASLLIQALQLLQDEAHALSEENTKVLEELSALAEQHEVGNAPQEAVNKVVSYIQATNAKYGAMSLEEARKKLGLDDEQTTH